MRSNVNASFKESRLLRCRSAALQQCSIPLHGLEELAVERGLSSFA